MYGYIYITTNLINNKKYIGKCHSNYFKGNKYLGSGKLLRIAIEKYGVENFHVELIDSADDLLELNNKEKYYIAYYDAVNSELFYNLRSGGDCGPGGPMFKGHKHSEETITKMKKSRKGSLNANFGNHWSQSDELKKLHSELSSGSKNGMYGKHHSDTTKSRISLSAKGRICITDGKNDKRVKVEELDYYLSNGWRKGRTNH